MSVSSIGQIITRGQVSQAVADTLNTWLGSYFPDVERQNGLNVGDLPRPPAPESVHGGSLDFLSWQKDLTPEIIVVAQPEGAAELYGDGTLSQWYEVQVGAVIVSTDEESATQMADLYGAVITGTIAGNDTLGGFAERTRLAVASRTEFEDPNVRTVQRSVTVFRTLIEQVASEVTRPLLPVGDGQLPPAPQPASSDSFVFTAVPDSQSLT